MPSWGLYEYESPKLHGLRGFVGYVCRVGAWIREFVDHIVAGVAWVYKIFGLINKILAWIGVDPKFIVGQNWILY